MMPVLLINCEVNNCGDGLLVLACGLEAELGGHRILMILNISGYHL